MMISLSQNLKGFWYKKEGIKVKNEKWNVLSNVIIVKDIDYYIISHDQLSHKPKWFANSFANKKNSFSFMVDLSPLDNAANFLALSSTHAMSLPDG